MELQNNKYYIGKTKNFNSRMGQHETGNGAAFTRLNGPPKLSTSLMQVQTGSAGEETKKTLEYMISHGINSVRGAEYCQIEDFTLNDCKRMSYAASHHLGRSPLEVENIFRDQIQFILNNSLNCNNFSNLKNDEENLLFFDLKNFINEKSITQNKEPFLILTNAVINELIINRPKTLEELEKIKGIGPKKIKEYGEEIINIIKTHLIQKCISCNTQIESNPNKTKCYKCWKQNNKK